MCNQLKPLCSPLFASFLHKNQFSMLIAFTTIIWNYWFILWVTSIQIQTNWYCCLRDWLSWKNINLAHLDKVLLSFMCNNSTKGTEIHITKGTDHRNWTSDCRGQHGKGGQRAEKLISRTLVNLIYELPPYKTSCNSNALLRCPEVWNCNFHIDYFLEVLPFSIQIMCSLYKKNNLLPISAIPIETLSRHTIPFVTLQSLSRWCSVRGWWSSRL